MVSKSGAQYLDVLVFPSLTKLITDVVMFPLVPSAAFAVSDTVLVTGTATLPIDSSAILTVSE